MALSSQTYKKWTLHEIDLRSIGDVFPRILLKSMSLGSFFGLDFFFKPANQILPNRMTITQKVSEEIACHYVRADEINVGRALNKSAKNYPGFCAQVENARVKQRNMHICLGL